MLNPPNLSVRCVQSHLQYIKTKKLRILAESEIGSSW